MIGYNIKIQEFHNGEVKFSIYPNGIYQVADSDKSYVDNERVERMLNKDLTTLIYNPFTETYEKLQEFESAYIEKQRAEHSERVSLNRTRNKIHELARSEKWEYFFTLTYDSAKTDRYDFSECLAKCRKWLNNQHVRNAPDLSYLFVPEQHKDGAWHMHGLVANCGNMTFKDSGHKSNGKVVYNLTGWRYGFSTATKIQDTYKATNYITKYITKELCNATKGRHRYIASKNLHEPVELVLNLIPSGIDVYSPRLEHDFEEWLKRQAEEIARNHGYDFKHETVINGFKRAIYQIYQFNEESEEKK